MRINAEFSERVVVHAATQSWVPSPMQGVDRKPLDRIGDEVARATSIVRYAPNSHFSPHVHDGGEEFLVLEGVFQDEYGDFGEGSYVRNPPTSSHTPRSDAGCVIFVKLWQFDLQDRSQVRIDTNASKTIKDAASGVVMVPLYQDAVETVRIETWPPGARIHRRDVPGGMELLVLDGGFDEGGDHLVRHSWLRLPVNRSLVAVAGPAGARVWIKTGHLRFIAAPSGE